MTWLGKLLGFKDKSIIETDSREVDVSASQILVDESDLDAIQQALSARQYRVSDENEHKFNAVQSDVMELSSEYQKLRGLLLVREEREKECHEFKLSESRSEFLRRKKAVDKTKAEVRKAELTVQTKIKNLKRTTFELTGVDSKLGTEIWQLL